MSHYLAPRRDYDNRDFLNYRYRRPARPDGPFPSLEIAGDTIPECGTPRHDDLNLPLLALILAGGYGTRLGSLGKNRSKVLLPVAGRPVVDYVLDRVRELPEVHGTLVVTNDRFYEQFVEWSEQAGHSSPTVSVLNDGTTGPENRLGAVGDVLFGIERERIDDDLLVMAGDNLCDFSLPRMAKVLRERGTCLAAYDIGRVEEASKYGNPEIDPNGRVVGFEEKPAFPTSSLIAVAIYMFRRADLGLFGEFKRQGHDLDLIGGFVQWAREQTPIHACIYDSRNKWWDIGDPQIYREADVYYGGSAV